MIRIAKIFCLALLLCVGGVAVWKYHSRLFPSDRVSPLYEYYQGREGIEADFVAGMRVADSLHIDVTRIHATDSAAWQRLEEDFALPNITDIEEDFLGKGRDVTRLAHYPDSLPSDSTLPPPVVAVSPLKHTITVFHVKNDREKHAIVFYNFGKQGK
jgi:hypothetical protein